ncbi:MAG TPA: mercury methylation corrinoid protein HgcA [Acidobacteriota bacterium]|nr:mercury methylation corrinoid protein HgcA [Acidobacteriota bacterium]
MKQRDPNVPWITGEVAVSGFTFPQVSTRLDLADTLGSFKARWSSARMNYAVEPGLYAVGHPGADSPVLVSANYKLSFDRLRENLSGLDLWILVIDTKGINVWCAAGKGTFGTEELVGRIAQVGLGEVVTGRSLILPQLSAPGVAAHEVLKRTGFSVIYGPVRAADLPEFLRTGQKATPSMKAVRFDLRDRLILTPIELAGALKPALILLGVLFALTLVRVGFAPFPILLMAAVGKLIPFLGAILAGAFFTPLLLPLIPGRAFAWKGWLLGLAWTLLYLQLMHPLWPEGWKTALLYLLLLPPIASFLAMNFTGASTYTSLSGVVKEMRIALPLQIVSAGLGILVLILTLGAAL